MLNWWEEPNSHVLAPRDLARPAQGTWLGVTKQGRIAVLTNYLQDVGTNVYGQKSRGSIVKGFLGLPPDSTITTEQYIDDLFASGDAFGAGGFSLVCGRVNEPLAVVSNQIPSEKRYSWIGKEKGKTVGLSNTAFEDRSWKKVTDGEELVTIAIKESVKAAETEDALIQRLLRVLSTDTLPRLGDDVGFDSYVKQLRNSIFNPVIGYKEEAQRAEFMSQYAGLLPTDRVSRNDDSIDEFFMQSFATGLYGTRQQSVILVTEAGRVRYFERTLFDDAKAGPIADGDRSFEFNIDT